MTIQQDATGEAYVWRFFRAGGFDQVRLDSGEDVRALPTLDQKLWVALACPTRGIEFDERTLDLIDSDHDGRIRAPDILAAVSWATALLKDPDDLLRGRDALPLAAIAETKAEGQEILASATTILRMLGKADADAVSIADTLAIERIYDATAFNGDGIIPVEAAEDEATRQVLSEIIAQIGAETDRSGKPGVSQASADRFFTEAAAYLAWHATAEAAAATVLPLGEATADAAATVARLQPKLDDYFTRCRLVRYDAKAADALNPPLAAYAALSAETLALDSAEIGALPLAQIEADRPLPLEEGINPAWAELVQRFSHDVVTPLLGARDRLAEADWQAIVARLGPYRAWMAEKPATLIEPLGLARIAALDDAAVRQRIDALIARDTALEPQMNAISRVEKLARLQRDLVPLLHNFISFRDFYTRRGKAAFQAGTLYLDGRSCELCVAVADETKHAPLATLSRIYLVYCRCVRAGEAGTLTIAAAFTAGDSDNLMVGRNGVFYDRKGRDWDATIVKIIENPISIRQAFWQPYHQLSRMIGDGIQKLAAARQQAAQTRMVQQVAHVESGVAAPASAAGAAPVESAKDQAFDAAKFAGIFAAIGLAIGAIGTAIVSLVTGFLHLAWWQMPLAIFGIILLISGPSVIIAALKLRRRNLGPILDACGWAVNTRLRINLPFGRALTATARLPPNAERTLADPYAEKRRPWALYLAILVVLAALAALWRLGYLARWLGH